MSYRIEGDYFEGCNCRINCRCIFEGGAYDDDACDAFLAWHIASGRKDTVELAGLNVAIARHAAPPQRTVILYVDERASPQQAAAIEAIFGGKAGGHPAVIAPIMGDVSAVKRAPISFEKADGTRRLRVGDFLELDAEQFAGLGTSTRPGSPATIVHATRWSSAAELRQGRATRIRYDDVWRFEASNRNSYIAEFAYEA